MANKLDSIVKINGVDYEVVAEEAKKVIGPLTIKTDSGEVVYDGSEAKTVDVQDMLVGDAEKIKVGEDGDGNKIYASITVSADEPANGDHGDIWFKY